jgi:hypothetical protein
MSQLSCLRYSDIMVWKRISNCKAYGGIVKIPNTEFDFRPKLIPFYGLHVNISAAYFLEKEPSNE